MKKYAELFLTILLAVNILIGLILTAYPLFNMVLNSIIILLALGLTSWVNRREINQAFFISLSFIIPAMTFLELLVGILSPSRFQNNWGLIIIILLVAFEILLTAAVVKRSKAS